MAYSMDYVLVYEHPNYRSEEDGRSANREKLDNLRRRFVTGMKKESLDIEEERVGKYVFVKVICSLERLYEEAENMRVELPLLGLTFKNQRSDKKGSRIERKMKRLIEGYNDATNVQVTAPFQKKCLDLFLEPNPNRGPILWSSLRCLLVYNILSNINIARKDESVTHPKRKGLAYLLMIGAYLDAFAQHEPSSLEPVSLNALRKDTVLPPTATSPEQQNILHQDMRRQLQRLWGSGLCRRQPMGLIRNYFGEKIAFYFAWVSTFITSLWIPAILGLVVFVFGVINRYADERLDEQGFLRYVEIIKNSSDNALTPAFAAIICLWGTVLMEVWKRRQISLAHQWHVEDFDNVEPERPQFYGTHTGIDPLTGESRQHYHFAKRLLKYCSSASVLLCMVILVFISVTSVILYRVFMTVSYCKKGDGLCSLLHGTILATFLNTVSIMILGKIYELIAVKLTDWENHQTMSEHNDALIIKLYAFQFANTYTSLVYTAFFRRDFNGVGIFGMGPEYTDNCGNEEFSNCMSMLSFQLLVLMIVKPFPKFFVDVILPLVKKCIRSCRLNEITDVQTDSGVSKQHYLLREKFKPSIDDFRLGEFNEKMIQYGYLMMFAASFPLAPLLALMFNVFDLRIDAKRLLWWTKRPTPFRDNDIGIWFHIIHFINVCAVISNAFLIAFNSELGRDQPLYIKFAIIIAFEHFVFLIKFGISLLIPDVPTWVRNSQRKERFLISSLMSRWMSPTENTVASSEGNANAEELNQLIELRQTGTKRSDLPQTRWSYG